MDINQIELVDSTQEKPIEKKPKAKNFSKYLKLALMAAVVGGSVLVSVPAFADPPGGDSPIDELKTETDKVGGIFDALVGPAVGSTVFAIGAVLVKRIAFS